MQTIQGYITGIDVHDTGLEPARCFAFVDQDGNVSTQVVTYDLMVQTSLMVASLKGVMVELTFDEENEYRLVQRVRVLDRGKA
jgi:hypothetical protein